MPEYSDFDEEYLIPRKERPAREGRAMSEERAGSAHDHGNCSLCDELDKERDAVREALELIAEDDQLVVKSGGAFTLQAYERRRDIARAALAAHPAPPAPAGEHAKVREIAARHAEDQARPSWATHPECAHCREAIRDRGILLAALQRSAGGGA